MEKLKSIRNNFRERITEGLSLETIEKLLPDFPDLATAIEQAAQLFPDIQSRYPQVTAMNEKEQIAFLQKSILNFYDGDAVNPYIPLAAKGPWIVTLTGAVVHDSGGYGMLGKGHNPDLGTSLSEPVVMANVMTGSLAQYEFTETLKREIGHKNPGRGCPYSQFVFLNSGSEAMSVATRVIDAHGLVSTKPGGRHAGKSIRYVSLVGSFHGRTDKPAQISNSTMSKYRQHLASFQNLDNLWTTEPNDIGKMEELFKRADSGNTFIQAVFLEPVMGEGNPGLAITPEFYQAARKLTQEHGSMLVIDSIQAGLRAHGVLSIVDYPGFEQLDPPDMETYSKALNAGQYPLSVLGLKAEAASVYHTGLYGNTMTSNPRAMKVGDTVLRGITPELRQNICTQGLVFVDRLRGLQSQFPDIVTGVTGTGLLFCVHIAEDRIKVVGPDGLEQRMRRKGIGVIHGGKNAIRFTPVFNIGDTEIDLIMDVLSAELAKVR